MHSFFFCSMAHLVALGLALRYSKGAEWFRGDMDELIPKRVVASSYSAPSLEVSPQRLEVPQQQSEGHDVDPRLADQHARATEFLQTHSSSFTKGRWYHQYDIRPTESQSSTSSSEMLSPVSNAMQMPPQNGDPRSRLTEESKRLHDDVHDELVGSTQEAMLAARMSRLEGRWVPIKDRGMFARDVKDSSYRRDGVTSGSGPSHANDPDDRQDIRFFLRSFLRRCKLCPQRARVTP